MYRYWRRQLYHKNAWTYFVNAGITNEIERRAVNTLIVTLENIGLYSRFARLWLRSPTSETASLTEFFTGTLSTNVNSVSWSTNGFAYDGATNYINTNQTLLALNGHSSGIGSNNLCFGVYIRTNPGGAPEYLCGANQALGGRPSLLRVNSPTLLEFTNGSLLSLASGSYFLEPSYVGLVTGAASSNVDRRIYLNALLLNQNTTFSNGALSSSNLFVGANNNNGTANFFFNYEECMVFIASSMNDSEMASIYTAIQQYQTDVVPGGRDVG